MLKHCVVFLPVYNGSKYIEKTIESVLKQSYNDFELIVTDDASTDSSMSILNKYAKQYPDKITLIRNEYNLGVGKTLYNSYKGYYKGAGFFAMIGHDDIWKPDFLSSQIRLLEEEKALVSFARVQYIDSKGELLTDRGIFYPEKLKKCDEQQLFSQLISRNFLCAPASVVNLNRCIPEEVTCYWGYNNDTLQDYEMWLHLCLQGKFVYNTGTSIFYRIHKDNLSDETKYILLSKLEYYMTLQRVFFSPDFWKYLYGCKDACGFIDNVIEILKTNLAYSNPCKLLLMDLCSNLMNRGFDDRVIRNTYNFLLMDSGIIKKCMKDGRELPSKISIVQCGSVKAQNLLECLKQNNNISFEVGLEKIQHFSLCVVQTDSMEYLINNEAFFRNLVNNQVIFIGDEKELQEAKRFYTGLYIDKDIDEKAFINKIFSYVEDSTHIYRNGFFDMLTAYHVPDLKTSVVNVELDEEYIRRIEYLEYIPADVEYIADGKKLIIANVHGTETLFEQNQIHGNEMYLRSQKPTFDIRMRLLINNKLYLCYEVTNSCDGLVLHYKAVSYFNNVVKANSFTNFNIGDVLGQYYALSTSTQDILNSTYYKLYVKTWKAIRKLNLEKPVKKVLNIAKRKLNP